MEEILANEEKSEPSDEANNHIIEAVQSDQWDTTGKVSINDHGNSGGRFRLCYGFQGARWIGVCGCQNSLSNHPKRQ